MTQEKATYQKKYTNADFYKDGKFDQEAAKEAFLDMFKFYGVPYTPLMEKDIWFTDFGLGDFENKRSGIWLLCTCYLLVAGTDDSGTCPCKNGIPCET